MVAQSIRNLLPVRFHTQVIVICSESTLKPTVVNVTLWVCWELNEMVQLDPEFGAQESSEDGLPG
ncbi:rCG42227 [Rattus norvegicus]|uniref:RCG42227 n=1 Tax=Rattus norvegicus TaxID=10116 RepID=A6K032_RAT|nr:rCG42227 [Rattus norvegicus]